MKLKVHTILVRVWAEEYKYIYIYIDVTWKFPRLTSIEINLSKLDTSEAPIEDFWSQVKGYKFFISGVKPETRWQTLLVSLFMITKFTQ